MAEPRARVTEGVEQPRDGDGIRDHLTHGEPAAAANTHAKVDIERSLHQSTPIEARARCVELALQESLPVGHRQDVRRDVHGGAGRRQRSRRDCAGVDRESHATVAGFAPPEAVAGRPTCLRGRASAACFCRRELGTEAEARCGRVALPLPGPERRRGRCRPRDEGWPRRRGRGEGRHTRRRPGSAGAQAPARSARRPLRSRRGALHGHDRAGARRQTERATDARALARSADAGGAASTVTTLEWRDGARAVPEMLELRARARSGGRRDTRGSGDDRVLARQVGS